MVVPALIRGQVCWYNVQNMNQVSQMAKLYTKLSQYQSKLIFFPSFGSSKVCDGSDYIERC